MDGVSVLLKETPGESLAIVRTQQKDGCPSVYQVISSYQTLNLPVS
jgi:hypothetical protein